MEFHRQLNQGKSLVSHRRGLGGRQAPAKADEHHGCDTHGKFRLSDDETLPSARESGFHLALIYFPKVHGKRLPGFPRITINTSGFAPRVTFQFLRTSLTSAETGWS